MRRLDLKFEDRRTPTSNDTVEVIKRTVHAKDTTTRIEKCREDLKVAGIGGSRPRKRTSKTSYEKEK